ncbi:MAG: hypothetical protein AB1Z66_13760 [Candidatus Limnocylindrales bacterium]
MFNATRVAAVVALLALTASLAYVAMPDSEPAPAPGAEMAPIDPADFGGFVGRMSCAPGEYGTATAAEWGSIHEGETYHRCAVEVDDPRFAGNMYAVHDYHKYDGKPMWGVRSVGAVLTNEEGHWVTTSDWGHQQPVDGTMSYAMQ